MKICDEYIQWQYEKAPRFDEGSLYQTKECDMVIRQRIALYEELCDRLKEADLALLEDYSAALAEETELECRHFFREGYLAGRNPPEEI